MAIKSRFARNVGIAVIAVPMLLYGASSFDTAGVNQPVIQVGDRSVNKATFDRQVDLGVESRAEFLGADAANSEELRNVVANQLMMSYAQDLLLQERADDVGLVPVDNEVSDLIRNTEIFQEDGEYSPELFEAQVEDKRFYVRQLKEQMLRRKIDQAFLGSEIVSDAVTGDLVSYLGERRIARKLEFPLEYGPDLEQVTEEDVQAYYDENPEAFVVPSRFKFEYIQLDAGMFEGQVDVDEQQLQLAQEERAARAEATEERQLGLIVLDSADAAEEAKGLLDAGEDFATVARERSIDAGSREAGGDIGLLARADLDEAYSAEVFDAQVGEVVGPFESDGQWLLFEVKGLIGGHVVDFDEAKEQMVANIKSEQAEILLSAQATELEEVAFEAVDRLDTVADDLGLEIAETDWILNRSSIEDMPAPFADEQVMRELFNLEFIEGGLNSSLLRNQDGVYFVARASAYEAQRQQTLSEVRDEVFDTLRQQEALIAQVENVSNLIEAQREGEIVQGLPFAEQVAMTVALAGELPEGLSERQRTLLFSVGESETTGLPAYAIEFDEVAEAVVVFRLEEILPGATDEEEIQQAINAQARFSSSLMLLGYINELESLYGLTFYSYDAEPDPS